LTGPISKTARSPSFFVTLTASGSWIIYGARQGQVQRGRRLLVGARGAVPGSRKLGKRLTTIEFDDRLQVAVLDARFLLRGRQGPDGGDRFLLVHLEPAGRRRSREPPGHQGAEERRSLGTFADRDHITDAYRDTGRAGFAAIQEDVPVRP